MDYNTPDLNSWPAKLVFRVGRKIRSNRSLTTEAARKKDGKAAVLRKRQPSEGQDSQYEVNELGEREYVVFDQASSMVKNKDHTEMLHRLAHHDSFDSLVDTQADRLKNPFFDSQNPEAVEKINILAELYAMQLAAFPTALWKRIASFLCPADAASLAISSRILYEKLGRDPLLALNVPENEHEKLDLLHRLDRHFPQHLLCFQCKQFHLRSNLRRESLKADYVANPLFTCPNVRNTVLPRMRLTHGRQLPYSFVQLAARGNRHSLEYGITPESLARQWKCKDSQWSHRSRYMMHDGHLLVRVVSQCIAPPAAEMTETSQRHLLYDREEYTPFFSVCAHWKDGNLMAMCKCALSHIPSPPKSYYQQLKKAPKINRDAARPNFIVQGCDDCRPARRCPECPSEYLIEVNMIEDHNDPVVPFKHAIVVTRWSDLGDGSSPYTNPEWAAIRGIDSGTFGASYDSFSHVGRRAVCGVFESKISGSIPGQRMVSMNPKNEKYGDEGHGWY